MGGVLKMNWVTTATGTAEKNTKQEQTGEEPKNCKTQQGSRKHAQAYKRLIKKKTIGFN